MKILCQEVADAFLLYYSDIWLQVETYVFLMKGSVNGSCASSVSLTGIGTYKLYLWYLKYKKNTEREIFKLVCDIINIVETHHQNASAQPGCAQESFLAINHVRDNLIPPKDRKKMSGLWEKAVKFLDENESR